MRKHKVFYIVIAVLVFSSISMTFAADFDIADKLVSEGKIPAYVRDKGNFVYNLDYYILGIKGYNVNLRSQPNTKSNVVVQLSDNDVDKWPLYLGEWTHPNGEYWVLGEYRSNGQSKTVWVFGKYADLMTKEKYASEKTSKIQVSRLSDKEYKLMLKNSKFAAADKALNQAWRNAKNSLSANEFDALKEDQNSWIKKGRDNEAKDLLSRMSRLEAYTFVTKARAEYINKVANGSISYSYENTKDINEDAYDGLPDELEDVPNDIPY